MAPQAASRSAPLRPYKVVYQVDQAVSQAAPSVQPADPSAVIPTGVT